MKRVLSDIAEECKVCVTRKRAGGVQPGHPNSPVDCGTCPFDVICVDTKPMAERDTETGFDMVLVVQCRFCGFTIGIPGFTTDGAEELSALLIRYVYQYFGLPRLFISDHDPLFASELFRETHSKMKISVQLETPYHYRTSSGVEQRIKNLADHLTILTATWAHIGANCCFVKLPAGRSSRRPTISRISLAYLQGTTPCMGKPVQRW